MKIVLAVLGGYMIIAGVLLGVKPAMVRRYSEACLQERARRGWAVFTAVLGVLIVWASPVSRTPLFIQVLGGLTLLKGAYLLLAPKDQLPRVLNWWFQRPRRSYVLWGLTSLVLGVAIITTL